MLANQFKETTETSPTSRTSFHYEGVYKNYRNGEKKIVSTSSSSPAAAADAMKTRGDDNGDSSSSTTHKMMMMTTIESTNERSPPSSNISKETTTTTTTTTTTNHSTIDMTSSNDCTRDSRHTPSSSPNDITTDNNNGNVVETPQKEDGFTTFETPQKDGFATFTSPTTPFSFDFTMMTPSPSPNRFVNDTKGTTTTTTTNATTTTTPSSSAQKTPRRRDRRKKTKSRQSIEKEKNFDNLLNSLFLTSSSLSDAAAVATNNDGLTTGSSCSSSSLLKLPSFTTTTGGSRPVYDGTMDRSEDNNMTAEKGGVLSPTTTTFTNPTVFASLTTDNSLANDRTAVARNDELTMRFGTETTTTTRKSKPPNKTNNKNDHQPAKENHKLIKFNDFQRQQLLSSLPPFPPPPPFRPFHFNTNGDNNSNKPPQNSNDATPSPTIMTAAAKRRQRRKRAANKRRNNKKVDIDVVVKEEHNHNDTICLETTTTTTMALGTNDNEKTMTSCGVMVDGKAMSNGMSNVDGHKNTRRNETPTMENCQNEEMTLTIMATYPDDNRANKETQQQKSELKETEDITKTRVLDNEIHQNQKDECQLLAERETAIEEEHPSKDNQQDGGPTLCESKDEEEELRRLLQLEENLHKTMEDEMENMRIEELRHEEECQLREVEGELSSTMTSFTTDNSFVNDGTAAAAAENQESMTIPMKSPKVTTTRQRENETTIATTQKSKPPDKNHDLNDKQSMTIKSITPPPFSIEFNRHVDNYNNSLQNSNDATSASPPTTMTAAAKRRQRRKRARQRNNKNGAATTENQDDGINVVVVKENDDSNDTNRESRTSKLLHGETTNSTINNGDTATMMNEIISAITGAHQTRDLETMSKNSKQDDGPTMWCEGKDDEEEELRRLLIWEENLHKTMEREMKKMRIEELRQEEEWEWGGELKEGETKVTLMNGGEESTDNYHQNPHGTNNISADGIDMDKETILKELYEEELKLKTLEEEFNKDFQEQKQKFKEEIMMPNDDNEDESLAKVSQMVSSDEVGKLDDEDKEFQEQKQKFQEEIMPNDDDEDESLAKVSQMVSSDEVGKLDDEDVEISEEDERHLEHEAQEDEEPMRNECENKKTHLKDEEDATKEWDAEEQEMSPSLLSLLLCRPCNENTTTENTSDGSRRGTIAKNTLLHDESLITTHNDETNDDNRKKTSNVTHERVVTTAHMTLEPPTPKITSPSSISYHSPPAPITTTNKIKPEPTTKLSSPIIPKSSSRQRRRIQNPQKSLLRFDSTNKGMAVVNKRSMNLYIQKKKNNASEAVVDVAEDDNMTSSSLPFSFGFGDKAKAATTVGDNIVDERGGSRNDDHTSLEEEQHGLCYNKMAPTSFHFNFTSDMMTTNVINGSSTSHLIVGDEKTTITIDTIKKKKKKRNKKKKKRKQTLQSQSNAPNDGNLPESPSLPITRKPTLPNNNQSKKKQTLQFDTTDNTNRKAALVNKNSMMLYKQKKKTKKLLQSTTPPTSVGDDNDGQQQRGGHDVQSFVQENEERGDDVGDDNVGVVVSPTTTPRDETTTTTTPNSDNNAFTFGFSFDLLRQ